MSDKHSEKRKASFRKYYHDRKTDPDFKKKRSDRGKTYYEKNKARINQRNNAHYNKNKSEQNEKKKAQRKSNPENARSIYKRYVQNNKEKIEERRKNNVQRLIAKRLRNRLRKALAAKNITKRSSVWELIGCDITSFKKHIESLFLPGMSWERIKEIHIDHKKPCALFDLTKEEEQKNCFHFTNLQPLWATDNLIKNKKYDEK